MEEVDSIKEAPLLSRQKPQTERNDDDHVAEFKLVRDFLDFSFVLYYARGRYKGIDEGENKSRRKKNIIYMKGELSLKK